VGEDFLPPEYRGQVTELTEREITIKLERELTIFQLAFHPDGTVKDKRVYVQNNNLPPKTFEFSPLLLHHSGLNPNYRGSISPYIGHKVTDLRAGDIVNVECYRFRGLEYCSRVVIERRFGGKVPPAVELAGTAEEHRLHNRMNAEQAREERAVLVVQRLGLRLLR
jgi:hypothetical protein